MKRFLTFLGIFQAFVLSCFGQDFKYKAPVTNVPENGFYRVALTPEVVNRLEPGFSDIRLYNRKNREVPYLLEQPDAVQTRRHFREYPVVSKSIRPGGNTTLVIRNMNRNKIDNIGLLIKNTNVVKKASLSGSANGQNWYALEHDFVLQSVTNTRETAEVKVLNFPLSDYEFYRLDINDSASAPLNILAAGYYDFSAEEGNFTEVKRIDFTQTDSSEIKKTFLKFRFNEPVLLDKLTFELTGPTFYRRNATVFARQTTYTRNRRRTRNEFVPVQNFQLESDSKNALPLSNFRSREFYIEIENADNPPLQFQAIRGFQLNRFLVAELKKGQQFEIRFGNPEMNLPTYELEYFREKIPQKLPELPVGNVTSIAGKSPAENPVNRFFQSSFLIWFALILVILLLGFMTYRMLKETEVKPSKH